jgi:hypothetical protein
LFRWLFIADSEILAITRIREKYSAQQKKLKGDEIMKKLLFIGILIAFLLIALPAMAAKPAGNLASAKTYAWHLSGAVMPVPPYGSVDIIGSDTASKLIVNQPNGNTEVTITGVMNGLTPLTTYTVYLSPGYKKYTPQSVVGTYKWLVLGTYEHDLIITAQNTDGSFTATGGYPAGSSPYNLPGETPEVITGGQVTGNQITFTTTYTGPYAPGYSAIVSGIIAGDGSMSGNSPVEWHTTVGTVTPASGSTGWPGLFTPTVQPFTFTTDMYGSGSWHVNLRDADLPATAAPLTISAWINNGGTLLISDSFTVVKG